MSHEEDKHLCWFSGDYHFSRSLALNDWLNIFIRCSGLNVATFLCRSYRRCYPIPAIILITKNAPLLRSEFVTQSFISLVSDDYRAFHLHVTPRNENLILFITDWDAWALKSRKNVFLKSLVVVVDGEGKKCGTFLEHPACFLREAVWRERKIITKKKTYDTYTQMNNKVRKVLGKASGCRRSVTSAEPRALIRPTTPPAMRPCSIRRHF